jgi:hypothetical protein
MIPFPVTRIGRDERHVPASLSLQALLTASIMPSIAAVTRIMARDRSSCPPVRNGPGDLARREFGLRNFSLRTDSVMRAIQQQILVVIKKPCEDETHSQ